MGDSITLFTVRGAKARLLKLVVGTPFLLGALLLVAVGLDAAGTAALVPLLVGAVLGLVGGRYYYRAVRSDEFSVTLSEGDGAMDGGGAE